MSVVKKTNMRVESVSLVVGMNLGVFLMLVARAAKEDSISFGNFRVMQCRSNWHVEETVRMNRPALSEAPARGEPSIRRFVLTPGEGPRSGIVKWDNTSTEDRARSFWALIGPLVRDLPCDKKTVIGLHEVSDDEMHFCVVRDDVGAVDQP